MTARPAKELEFDVPDASEVWAALVDFRETRDAHEVAYVAHNEARARLGDVLRRSGLELRTF